MDVDSFLDGGFERLAGSDSEDLPSTAGSDSDTDSGASTDSEDMDDEEVLKMLEEAREEAERGAADEDGPSSSASDDEEDGADPAIAAKTRVLRDSIRSHKEQLEQLRRERDARAITSAGRVNGIGPDIPWNTAWELALAGLVIAGSRTLRSINTWPRRTRTCWRLGRATKTLGRTVRGVAAGKGGLTGQTAGS